MIAGFSNIKAVIPSQPSFHPNQTICQLVAEHLGRVANGETVVMALHQEHLAGVSRELGEFIARHILHQRASLSKTDRHKDWITEPIYFWQECHGRMSEPSSELQLKLERIRAVLDFAATGKPLSLDLQPDLVLAIDLFRTIAKDYEWPNWHNNIMY